MCIFLAMQSGFKQRKFSSNHLTFALKSVLLNEKAYLELINKLAHPRK